MKKQSAALILVFAVTALATAAAALMASQKTSAAQRSDSPSYQAPPPSQAPPGDIERGRLLFMGYQHLQNGGPPCMGCHNADSNGLLGGGALGPDLTDVSTRWGVPGLATALADISWPTMKPIFSVHPLAPQEQADLLAFLVSQAGKPAPNREWLVIGISLAGFVGAVVLIGLLYRRRLRGVRIPLVRAAQSKR